MNKHVACAHVSHRQLGHCVICSGSNWGCGCLVQVLAGHVAGLLRIAVVLLLPDGLQMTMAGIFQVCEAPLSPDSGHRTSRASSSLTSLRMLSMHRTHCLSKAALCIELSPRICLLEFPVRSKE